MSFPDRCMLAEFSFELDRGFIVDCRMQSASTIGVFEEGADMNSACIFGARHVVRRCLFFAILSPYSLFLLTFTVQHRMS